MACPTVFAYTIRRTCVRHVEISQSRTTPNEQMINYQKMKTHLSQSKTQFYTMIFNFTTDLDTSQYSKKIYVSIPRAGDN